MTSRSRSASVLVPCTCGELVQGVVGGRAFLVSCPIDLFSRVTVTLGDEPSAVSDQPSAVSSQPSAVSAGPPGGRHGGRPLQSENGASRPAVAPYRPGGRSAWCEVRGTCPHPVDPSSGRSTPLSGGPHPDHLPEGEGKIRSLPGREGYPFVPMSPSPRVPLPPSPRLSVPPSPSSHPVHPSHPVYPGPVTSKAEEAVRTTLRYVGMPVAPFGLRVDCPLPPSKGFGTSTADVVGAIFAAAAAAGVVLGPEEVARIAVSVEPSDGTMFPGLAAFAHRDASWFDPIGPAPPLLVAVLEFEGTVDTLEFNSRLDLDSAGCVESAHTRALDLLRRGLMRKEMRLIGEAATLSARTNQRVLSKPYLDEAIDVARDAGALGVCAAHSGTALGALFSPGEFARAERFLASARERLDGLRGWWVSSMVDGGPRWE